MNGVRRHRKEKNKKKPYSSEENAKEYAKSGVDVLSSGALTHSFKSSDFNMLLSMN